MADKPYYTDFGWKLRQPLKFRTGAEVIPSFVLASGTVSADSNGNKFVAKGTLVCKLTSGADSGKYGPYLKTASYGQQTLAYGAAAILTEGHDLSMGDEEAAGVIAFAAFDYSELTLPGLSNHGATLTALKAAFPNCEFLD